MASCLTNAWIVAIKAVVSVTGAVLAGFYPTHALFTVLSFTAISIAVVSALTLLGVGLKPLVEVLGTAKPNPSSPIESPSANVSSLK